MDGPSAKKSNSLETLVIQNIANVNELKAKLNDIIKIGKDYEYDVSNCLTALLKSNDQEIVTLTVQAISEFAKCEDKREILAKKDTIEPILNILNKEFTSEKFELFKQCCRALANLCCDCDTTRNIILENRGVPVLIKLLKLTLDDNSSILIELKLFTCKTIQNFTIGGQEYSVPAVDGGLIDLFKRILSSELDAEDMNDDLVSTVLLVMSVINDNSSEFLFENYVNSLVLRVLQETTNIEISEYCLDHLQAQAEHDSVKTLLAQNDGVQLVCTRLEQLVSRHNAGGMNAEDSEVQAIMKSACDLIIIVLTGDEAMHLLYGNGTGAVYRTMVRWLDSSNYHLLTTAVLAIGNFARQDDYCAYMMESQIFDKLLDIFEHHYNLGQRMVKDPNTTQTVDMMTVTKVQQATLSSLRNLTVPAVNKKVAAEKGRVAPILLKALPNVEDHLVAYKLLAAIRMLVDGQDSVARQLGADRAALAAAARWAQPGEFAGPAGEAPRLLAWTLRQLRGKGDLVQVEGCVSSLVNMLVASHSVMQNEAILALTLLAVQSLKENPTADEKTFITQLIKSEIGKHISVLIEMNTAKMPLEVAENLMAFLDITSKRNEVALDLREAKVNQSLNKLLEARKDLSDDLKTCILNVVEVISDKTE